MFKHLSIAIIIFVTIGNKSFAQNDKNITL